MASATTTAKSPASRGAFIVLEGLDRSGKTTQVKRLEERFVQAGHKVAVMRFPDRTTPIGQMIDSYLKSSSSLEDHVIHLLFSANRWEAVERIKSLLAAGTTVLCDRYYYSGIVYSAAKQNPTLSLSWARAPERGLPRPDMVLFLDLDEEAASSRGGWGNEIYEKAEMQRRVRELFRALSTGGSRSQEQALFGDESGGDGRRWNEEAEDLVVVDAGGTIEHVAEQIWEKVSSRFEQVQRGELGERVRVIS